MSAVAWAKLTAVWQNLMTIFEHKKSPLTGYDLLNKPINFGRSRCCLRSLSLKLSYMWTAEWRIIWRKIIAVIYAIFVVAKRKPEKKNSVRLAGPVRFLFATAKVAYITAMIFLHIILYSSVHINDFHIFTTSSTFFPRVYNEPIQRPALSWLVSLIGRALHRYHRDQGFESRKGLNFFQAFFSQLQKLRIKLRWSFFN